MTVRGNLLLITILFIGAHATPSILLNCSETYVCSEFRQKHPDTNSLFRADLESVKIDENGIAHIQLINSNSQSLVLTVHLLKNDNFRLIIQEDNSDRYHLQDALIGEPEYQTLTIENIEDDLVILKGPNTEAKVTNYPFNIRFYKEGLEVLFDGTRLLFDKESDVFTYGITYPKASALYGLFQQKDFNLQNTAATNPYKLKNSWYFALINSYGLSNSVPLLYGHGSSITAGTFLHNAAEQWVDVEKSNYEINTYIMVESGAFDLFVLLGPKPVDVIRQYASLTGFAQLPPLWSLGYIQGRRSYDNQSEVEDVLLNFNNSNFPMDAIYAGSSTTAGYRYFTWDLINFDNPIELQNNIGLYNSKLIALTNVQIKVDDNYTLYQESVDQDFFLKYSNGTIYQGTSWPGWCSYLDFLNPAVRKYFGSYYNYTKYPKTNNVMAGFYISSNYPQTDEGVDGTLPTDFVHYNNVTHKQIHNIYSLLTTQSAYNGLLIRDPNVRPFIMTESNFAGSQRYAAVFITFNDATWEYLRIGVSRCLSAAISGLPFCGSNIGGYYNDPDIELLQRWYQIGAWMPLYRTENVEDSGKRREPFLFNGTVQNVLRVAMNERYQHLPVFYTLFYEHSVYGDPVIRPLFIEYPSDEKIFSEDQVFLLGQDILIAAVGTPGLISLDLYLPGEDDLWYEIHTNRFCSGGFDYGIHLEDNYIPVFYRSGSVIVKKLISRHNTEEMRNDPYTIIINEDSKGYAEGTLYEDDFISFDYQQNIFNYWKLIYEFGNLTILPIGGSRNSTLNIDSVIVNGPSKTKNGVYNSQVHQFNHEGLLLREMDFDSSKEHILSLK